MPGGPSPDIALPAPATDGGLALEAAVARRRSIRDFAGRALTIVHLSQLLWSAQGITGRQGQRTAPSAGAMYPLETLVMAGTVAGLGAGAYRYGPGNHALSPGPPTDGRRGLAHAALGQMWIADAPVILVLGAAAARTRQRYQSRAGRYIHMEVGHAAQNVCLQAVSMGLGATVVGAFHGDPVKALLGMAGDEKPYALIPVGWPAP